MTGNLPRRRAHTVNDLPACVDDPDRWSAVNPDDNEAKALCRACPQRAWCAREACRIPSAQGLWAGIVIPESGRARTFARRQLRSLVEHGDFAPTVAQRRAG